MSRAVIVSVTAEHIASGRRESLTRSPIALAVLDAVPGATSVAEYHEGVDIALRGRSRPVECALPLEAQGFAIGFDNGDDLGPVTFTIQIPGEVNP